MNEIQRIAVVTGGNRGLGRALCEELAGSGMHVVLTARTAEGAATAASELVERGLDVSGHQLDVTDPASVVRLMADTGYHRGRLDVLINNAAVAIDRGQLASAADMEKVWATMNANLMGTWRCCTAAIPEMRRNGYGRIVNITSHMSTFAELGPGSVAYRISKTAANALTVVLAAELADEDIRVNAASPGRVDTRMAYGGATQSPEAAAADIAWLATLPTGGPSGHLFHRRAPLPW